MIENLMETFRFTDMLHRKVLEKSVMKTGVYRSQHRILMFLNHHQLSSQKDIAVAMEVSTSAVAVSLKKLEKNGYICRVINEQDNRYYQVDITEKGKAIVQQSKQIFQYVDRRMFEGFTDEEKSNMLSYLNKMHDNLSQMERELKQEEE